MVIPKSIAIKKVDGTLSAFLSPKSDGLKGAYVDCRLNGESTFEFMLPATSEKIAEFTTECQIHVNDKVYNLLKEDAIDTVRDEKNTLWAKFMAIERWAELDTDFIEPSLSNDPTNPIPSDLAVIIVSGGSNLSGNQYVTGSAAHALYAALDGSAWSIGTVDVTGVHDIEAEKVSRLQLIKMIQETWGGYLIWDSVNKIVHLRDANIWQNYTGFQIRYCKNLKHITRTQSNKLITRMYCFGHDELDIASVNGGIKYLINTSYTSRDYVGIYKNQDIYDADELMAKGIEELSLICRPRYLYKVKAVDLRTLEDYSHENFELGDMADIIDSDVAPDNPRTRIIRHKYNVFQPWECEIDIGDPEERLIESLKASFNTTSFINGIFNGNGQMSGQNIEELSISANQIQDLAITSDKIENLAITNSHIANLTITGGKIANATITNAKINDLSADKITAGTITATIGITSPSINGGQITGALIRTAETGKRMEITGSSITSYDENDSKHGFAIESLWNEIKLYSNGSEVINLYASQALAYMKFLGHDVLRHNNSGTTSPYGDWSCGNAYFTGLQDYTGYYATRAWSNLNFVKATQDIKIQYFSDHIEVNLDGGVYKTIYFDV